MEKLCTIAEELYKGGVVLEVDLTRVQISLKSLAAQHDQCVTLHEQQLNLLRFLLDLPPEAPLEVSSMPSEVVLLHTAGISRSLPELRLLSARQKLADRQIKAVRAGYIPSISLGGQLGAVGYQEKLHHYFHTGVLFRTDSSCRYAESAAAPVGLGFKRAFRFLPDQRTGRQH